MLVCHRKTNTGLYSKTNEKRVFELKARGGGWTNQQKLMSKEHETSVPTLKLEQNEGKSN